MRRKELKGREKRDFKRQEEVKKITYLFKDIRVDEYHHFRNGTEWYHKESYEGFVMEEYPFCYLVKTVHGNRCLNKVDILIGHSKVTILDYNTLFKEDE